MFFGVVSFNLVEASARERLSQHPTRIFALWSAVSFAKPKSSTNLPLRKAMGFDSPTFRHAA